MPSILVRVTLMLLAGVMNVLNTLPVIVQPDIPISLHETALNRYASSESNQLASMMHRSRRRLRQSENVNPPNSLFCMKIESLKTMSLDEATVIVP